jgi:hypothetical protein
MGQITSIAARQNGFAPFIVGVEATFLFQDRSGALELVNGPVADITPTHVVIDDINVDGSKTRFNIAQHTIEERFL